MSKIIPQVLASLGAAFAIASAPAAFAQSAARLIVPFSAGGTQDLVARAIQPALNKALGESVIIENRGGAGGTVGMAVVASSAADGKTMALVSSSLHTSAWLYPKTTFDVTKSFAPTALIGRTGFVLVATSSLPVNSLAELIAYGKAHPESLNYASAGNGSAGHLGMAYLMDKAHLQMQHIPFKSTGEAMGDVLAGRSQVIMSPTIGVVPFLGDSRLKIIGLTSSVGRTGALAQVPLLSQSGLPGFTYESWYGLVVPTNTPKARIEQLNDAIAKVVADPSVITALTKAGIEPARMSVEDFSRFMASDYTEMGKLVRSSGARVE